MMLVYTFNESCSYYRKHMNLPSPTASKLYYYLQWCGHFVCKQDFAIKRRNFDSVLLLYTISGEGVLNYLGKQYELKPDTLAVIDCNKLHEYHTADCTKWNFKYIHFNGNMSLDYCEYIHNNFGAVINTADNQNIINGIESIIELKQKRDILFEVKVSSLIYQTLTELICAASSYGKISKNLSAGQYVESAIRYIESNYMCHIDTDDIAKAVNVSRCYFSTIFKRETGMTPYKYLSSYRIRYARELLINRADSIEEIASQTGFLDAGSFIRAFKASEGVTPAKFRKEVMI